MNQDSIPSALCYSRQHIAILDRSFRFDSDSSTHKMVYVRGAPTV